MKYKDFEQEYQSGGIHLYQADCMKMLSQIPDKYYSLCICDPPYGIGNFNMKNGGSKTKKINRAKEGTYLDVKWNNNIPQRNYFTELKRVSVNQIIWGANYYNCFSENGAAIVWYKKIGHPNLSDCEIASVSFNKKVDFVHIDWQSGFSRVQREGAVIHPCQKPVKLYEWLLKNYAKPGDRILDTHLGSGSIAIACHNMGYSLDGYEIDKDYYEAAVKRLEDHKRQGLLFTPKETCG